MNLSSIKLDDQRYHDYLEGKEVHCPTSIVETRDIAPGERVLVYRDTVTASTAASPPRSEMQSEYIGVEGEVTGVSEAEGNRRGIVIRKV